jgi:pyruvate formate lyase activating enzyme
MKIAGIEKCSFVDYPGHLAAVIFTSGCNLDCYYCHNHSLVRDAGPGARMWFDTEIALAWLDKRRGFLDGVVITGGEPTLQPDLADFIRKVRAKEYRVKLDTNGTRPAVLRALIEENLLDYVAMDIKAPVEKYEVTCGAPVDHRVIHESIDILLAGSVDYEFRTTVLPHFTESDIFAMARRIRGARRYVLQQYRRPASEHPDPRLDAPPHASTWPLGFLPKLEDLVQVCDVRGFDLPTRPAVVGAA